ncbi:GNAT family N-acetyltransferase [Actinoplanes auranticolor]|uniref:N-acetyltransferase YobR n=1 Tax=Actinoplanes auranticolor TaxID=47988 RepID=A0A919SDV5_9ACTN|nr:GNAT family N-acetyltransferase [Actinoplanes auranticolor]GIM70036.1 putative N-acetyltransferase YobR [Actinoplanes auranticolor]
MFDPMQGARAVRIERSAAAAWPAGRTEAAAGWLLRHTPGVARRRSNSALPPAPDRHPERSLDVVEAFYRAAGLPVTVQVGPAEQHRELDAALAARGYRREAPTLVLTAATADVIAATDPVLSLTVEGVPSAAWLAAHQSLNGPGDTSALARQVLARVPAPAAFVRAEVEERDAAIGMVVADGEWAGVFCMATSPEHRRRGLALAVLGAAARWAAGRDCAELYLQVEKANIAARELYSRVGFAHSHHYHYRVLGGAVS